MFIYMYEQSLSLLTGRPKTCIKSATFTNVVFRDDQVYAAAYRHHSRNDVIVYQYVGSRGFRRWLKARSFEALKEFITMSVGRKDIKCGSTLENTITNFTINGSKQHVYETAGNDDDSKFAQPYIYDLDGEGNVLVADQGNQRLLVMSEQGEFSVLQLQQPVPRPRSAVLWKDCLYVTSDDTKTIYKYSISDDAS